jgi:tetratricopeptide (TPR) repeat protein
MRFIAATIASLGLAIGASTYAEGPDDSYVRIYNLIQQADNMNQSGQKRAAFEKYTEAQTALKGLQSANPDWNSKLVQFRLGYVGGKLAAFGPPPSAAPAEKSAAETAKSPTPAATPAIAVERPVVLEAAPPAPATAELNNRLKTLMDDNQRLGSEKATLEAKLREALSVQPATVDPKELAKAEARILDLQKENDLLKTTLQQEKEKALKTADTAALDETKKLLAATQQKLGEQAQTIAALTEEKRLLETKVKTLSAAPIAVPTASVPAPAPAQTPVAATTTTEIFSPTEVSLAMAENEILKKRVVDLEKQIQAPLVPPAYAVPTDSNVDKSASRQVKQLEQEKNDLKQKLASTSSELAGLKKKKETSKASASAKQLEALEAKLAALETKKAPYTAEELAVLKKQPAPAVTEMAVKETSPIAIPAKAKELPAGVGALINEAQRDFAARRYDEAEKKYKAVLAQDENNALTLGYLAVLYLEKNDLPQAEAAASKALAQDPSDSKHLALLGIVKVRQSKFDEAMDPLTRSVKANPGYALAQNYLGIALTEKGQREAAEAAFRKAVQIAPDYANAHHNLAFVYATQDPPFIELAKYHYQKAIAGGEPRNEALEKLIEGKK